MIDERRRRIGRRHLLHPAHRAPDIATATAAMVAMHATDPASVFLGLLARTRSVTVADIEQALYDDRTLVRVMAMRRTIFVTRTEDAHVPMAACGLRVAVQQRAALLKQLARGSDIADPAAFVETTMARAAAAIAERGEVTPRELTAAVPELQARWNPAPDSKWGASSPVTSRILSQLAMEGVVERSRPVGNAFTSTQYRWRRSDPAVLDRARSLGEDAARVILLGDWLRTFGPATEDDLVWWSGLPKGAVRGALAAIDTVPVDLDGLPGLRHGDDSPTTDNPGPWVALLPGLDPTPMGWKRRDFYVGDLTPLLFDTAGNVGPTVWADGRIVGVWAPRDDGSTVVELVEDIDDEHHRLLDAELARVDAFVGDVRVTPRFRTPLEKQLATRTG